MAQHQLEPSRATLHGHFSRDLPPALTVDSGDTVVVRTLDAGWNLERHSAPGVRARQFEPRDPRLDDGHALCGPIAVRGARPGDTLEVEIREVRPTDWGWNAAGGVRSELNVRLGVDGEPRIHMLWSIAGDRKTATNQYGHTVRLRPFLGVMGMPPREHGVHSTTPPRRTGGNMDCKELVAGSRLFLPIEVPDALFSLGDGHAAQGDGEASTIAIETPMERVELVLRVHGDMPIRMPRAETPAGWLTLGFHHDLDEATHIALAGMLDLLGERFDVGRKEALALASVAVDLRVSQIVNEVRGAHALLAPDAIS
ncbi:MAG TPA: acetamidase/formamidase family protein [Candidatus Dormibacteraeota bacterium]|nr:acetamidase/formamidase family protein [Candidatus Dormibacteraeota bacterium]